MLQNGLVDAALLNPAAAARAEKLGFRVIARSYELFTFPFPAPPGYVSVIQPEYVFSVEATSLRERPFP